MFSRWVNLRPERDVICSTVGRLLAVPDPPGVPSISVCLGTVKGVGVRSSLELLVVLGRFLAWRPKSPFPLHSPAKIIYLTMDIVTVLLLKQLSSLGWLHCVSKRFSFEFTSVCLQWLPTGRILGALLESPPDLSREHEQVVTWMNVCSYLQGHHPVQARECPFHL